MYLDIRYIKIQMHIAVDTNIDTNMEIVDRSLNDCQYHFGRRLEVLQYSTAMLGIWDHNTRNH